VNERETVGSEPDTASAALPALAPTGRPALSQRERDILGFEHKWLRHAGAKEEAIRVEFGLSAARYYQVLNNLLDSPAALVHDPVLVNRLQRLRDVRAAQRPAGPLLGVDSSPVGIRR
jgi:hypothetical protein